ncbi:MAG: DUF262 domain-containing protein [Pseudomonadota bacterium]
MSDGISQLSVRGLFSDEADYVIPMYQRNYAWGEGEVTQLIQDVLDEMPGEPAHSNAEKPYYIGTLVVFRRTQQASERPLYEVIDGQQRLTTLCLLASYFRSRKDELADAQWFDRQCVRFESRPKSDRALAAIFEGKAVGKHADRFHTDEYNSDIINGYQLVQKLLPRLIENSPQATLPAFAKYLSGQVQIMRVQVPDDTDLNHYFEIMNNRGEQLEKHEVLKSRLMSVLDEKDHPVLHRVWEACSNMGRYIQMGFTRDQRDGLFGKEDWGRLVPGNFAELSSLLANAHENSDSGKALRLTDIIKPGFHKGKRKSTERGDDEPPERFNTVINFPNFLLQVLRVSTGQDITLDDKRLISVFEKHVLRTGDAEKRVKHFVYDLLRCKLLFDHYIIKREFAGNVDAWSLKRLKWQSSSKSNDYVNTFGDEDQGDDANRRILMLQSALHVSAPTMVYKHWLNAVLHFLYQSTEVKYPEYLERLESVARCFVYDRFLAQGSGAEYYDMIYQNEGALKACDWGDVDESRLRYGNIVNNLVFNYLDYLLWLEYRKKKGRIRDYEFSFRSSVEHFYPQNPMEGHARLQEEVLHSFGNLCLISHSKNSTLSRYMPKAKKDHYEAGGLDSIKQWLMMQPDESGKYEWGKDEIRRHYDAMIDVFKADLAKGAVAND